MIDICIRDPFEQCFHNCPTCPQCDDGEVDEDMLYEEVKEREL